MAIPELTVFLLTEDSGRDAPEVLQRLVEKRVFLARPGTSHVQNSLRACWPRRARSDELQWMERESSKMC